jgi:hypothetical protein
MAKLTFGWGMFRQLFDWTDPDNVQIKADYLANAADAVVTVSPAVTAHAGGGQASAVAITADFTNITVCATAGDSVKLPTAAVGKTYTVTNRGAASADVFPFTGDTINGGSANAAVKLPVGSTLQFIAINATDWKTNQVTLVTDTIVEATVDAGVTIDSVTMKDGGVSNSLGSIFAGFYVRGTQQALSGDGAINITSYLTNWTTTGANAGTLANATQIGQLKKIALVVDGGDGTLTPTSLAGANTITFNDAGDFVLLFWNGIAWAVIENSGCTVA